MEVCLHSGDQLHKDIEVINHLFAKGATLTVGNGGDKYLDWYYVLNEAIELNNPSIFDCVLQNCVTKGIKIDANKPLKYILEKTENIDFFNYLTKSLGKKVYNNPKTIFDILSSIDPITNVKSVPCQQLLRLIDPQKNVFGLLKLAIQSNRADIFECIANNLLKIDKFKDYFKPSLTRVCLNIVINNDIRYEDHNEIINFLLTTYGTETVISKNPNINAKAIDYQDDNGNALLHKLVLKDRIDLIKPFVDNGANPNIQNKDGNTPLFLAIQENNALEFIQIANFIESKNININLKNNEGMTPLLCAIQQNNPLMVDTLLEKNNLTIKPQDFNDLWKIAIRNNNTDILDSIYRYQMSQEENQNSFDIKTILPILLQKQESTIEYDTINFFIDKSQQGITIVDFKPKDIFDIMSTTPLGNIQQDNFGLLLKNLNPKSKILDLAELAFKQSNQETFQYIINLINNTIEKTNEEFNNLTIFVKNPDEIKELNALFKPHPFVVFFNEVLENKDITNYDNKLDFLLKLEFNNDLGYKFVNKEYLLHKAIENNRLDLIEFFFEPEPKCNDIINLLNEDGKTPLMLAAERNNYEVIDYLISKGAKIDGIENVNSPLFQAVLYNDLNLLKHLVEKGKASVNIQDTKGNYLLYIAVEKQPINIDIIKYLVENGADVKKAKGANDEPLLLALCINYMGTSNKKYLEILDYLIKNDANINETIEINDENEVKTKKIKNSYSILYNVVHNIISKTPAFVKDSDLNLVKYLIDKGADVNENNPNEESPLLELMIDNCEHFLTPPKVDNYFLMLDYFIQKGARIKPVALQQQEETVGTLLQQIIKTNNTDILEIILNRCRDLITNDFIIYALNNDSGKIINTLFDHKIIDKQPEVVYNLLFNYIKYLKVESKAVTFIMPGSSTKVLANIPTNSSIKVFLGQLNPNPLTDIMEQSIKEGNLDVVKLIIENGININIQNDLGESPLHLASANGKRDIVKYLVEKGANIDLQDKQGQTPVFFVVDNNEIGLLDLFLKKGADVTKKNKDGLTPLALGCLKLNCNAVKHMLDKGDKKEQKKIFENSYYNEHSPMHLVCGIDLPSSNSTTDNNGQDYNKLTTIEEKQEQNIDYLLAIDIKYINLQDNPNQDTPLHIAVKKNNLELVKYLVEKGANVNAQDKQGNTPLQLAVLCGYKEIVDFFIQQKSVDIYIKNEKGQSAVDMSNRFGTDKSIRESVKERDENNKIEIEEIREQIINKQKKDEEERSNAKKTVAEQTKERENINFVNAALKLPQQGANSVNPNTMLAGFMAQKDFSKLGDYILHTYKNDLQALFTAVTTFSSLRNEDFAKKLNSILLNTITQQGFSEKNIDILMKYTDYLNEQNFTETKSELLDGLKNILNNPKQQVNEDIHEILYSYIESEKTDSTTKDYNDKEEETKKIIEEEIRKQTAGDENKIKEIQKLLIDCLAKSIIILYEMRENLKKAFVTVLVRKAVKVLELMQKQLALKAAQMLQNAFIGTLGEITTTSTLQQTVSEQQPSQI